MTEDQQIIEDLLSFTDDPLRCVRYLFPWGEEGTQLADAEGPRQWQAEALEALGKHLQNNDTRFDPFWLARASGHGIGKELAYSVVIPTPNGDKQWKDVYPGDFVFGKNGKPTRVIQRHEQGIKDIYKVKFDDGSFVLAGLDHLWNVRGRQERRRKLSTWRTLSTAEILEKGVLRLNGSSYAKQWEIPKQEPAQYPEKEVFSPYSIGIWLGDGRCDSGRITSTHSEIWLKLPKCNVKNHVGTIPGLTKCLKDEQMIVDSSDKKFISDSYKFNSIENRKELLAGLLDSDGEVHISGSIGFCSTSKQLVDDVIWLTRSLGGKATLQDTIKKAGYKKDGIFRKCKDAYRCTINLDWNPFTVKHKKEKWKESEHR